MKAALAHSERTPHTGEDFHRAVVRRARGRMGQTRFNPETEATVGLMDKVKAQAGQVAQKAQDAAQSGHAKLDEVQEKRRVDGLYRDLGAAVYAQRTGSDQSANADQIDRLIAEISSSLPG
ncbi:MAG TPA: hypothetical protein VNF50_10715 [Acidimicrobiales bacterium]|nr:hypothetical protein [Acidimicrobiales bacterium]